MLGYRCADGIRFAIGQVRQRVVWAAAALVFLPLWPLHANDGLLQLPPRPTGRVEDVNRNPTLMPNRRVYVTYGGNILLRFPNYTDRIMNFRDGAVPGEGGDTGIIFHNQAGMSWDGRGLILTPNYSTWMVTQNRYARGMVGDPQTSWPWPCAPCGEGVAEPPLEFPPPVGYRSVEPQDTEGYVGPDHGPMPQPPLVQKSYVEPLKPELGLDGKIHYVPLKAPQSAAVEP